MVRRPKPYQKGRTYAIDSDKRKYPTNCPGCGEPMGERVRSNGQYDVYSGRPQVRVLLACENWPVLNHPVYDAGVFLEVAEQQLEKDGGYVSPKERAPLGFQMRSE